MPPHSHICGNIQLIENLSQQEVGRPNGTELRCGVFLEEAVESVSRLSSSYLLTSTIYYLPPSEKYSDWGLESSEVGNFI